MVRRTLPKVVGLALVVVVAVAGTAGASVGELTVDPREGTAYWEATITCTPGDDVEIDVYIRQGKSEAFTEVFLTCPASGDASVAAQTWLEEGSDPLHPGRAEMEVHRRDYVAADDYQEVNIEHTVSDIVLKPLK